MSVEAPADAGPVRVDCTVVGCGSLATVKISIQDTSASLQSSSLVACRNDSCDTLSLLELMPSEQSNSFSNSVVLSSGARVKTLTNAIDDYELLIDWAQDGVTGQEPDHDKFRIVLTDATGAEVVNFDEDVPYTVKRPNGTCGPTCRNAEIDL